MTGAGEEDETPPSDATATAYPGARAADRHREVRSAGLRLAVHEWGEADAPPLLLAHGGFDFARTFDLFAPRLADAGWRVVTWDQRGQGTPSTPRSTTGTPTCATPWPSSTR
ncbi:hypothetical protein BH18ACT1_BH18ACT1_13170 [soil metagenome]